MQDNNSAVGTMSPPAYFCPSWAQVGVVKAGKIAEIQLVTTVALLCLCDGATGCVTVDSLYMFRHNPQVGGYYIEYPDGYQSFCPADVFEARHQREGAK